MRLFLHQLFVFVLCTLLCGCVTAPPRPQMTQLQLREMQTRSYASRSPVEAMRAVINALQDEGFIVKNADKDLGFLQATRESDLDPNQQGPSFFTMFRGPGFDGVENQPRWDKALVVECSGNVAVNENKTQVRLIFQRKILDNIGGIRSVEQILEPEFYQMIFAKIDKSLFIQGQKL